VLYRPNSPLSRAGVAFLQSRLQAFNEQFLIDQLDWRGIRARAPTRTYCRSVQTRGVAASLTTLIPLILILMTITGAVYPAIDLTAGEPRTRYAGDPDGRSRAAARIADGQVTLPSSPWPC